MRPVCKTCRQEMIPITCTVYLAPPYPSLRVMAIEAHSNGPALSLPSFSLLLMISCLASLKSISTGRHKYAHENPLIFDVLFALHLALIGALVHVN